VNKCRRVARLSELFQGQCMLGQLAQLIVHRWQELAGGHYLDRIAVLLADDPIGSGRPSPEEEGGLATKTAGADVCGDATKE
jgi:hypothetical protein